METFWKMFIGFLMGSWLTAWICEFYIQDKYEAPMEALGIEKFQKHEINTTYKIVYKKETK